MFMLYNLISTSAIANFYFLWFITGLRRPFKSCYNGKQPYLWAMLVVGMTVMVVMGAAGLLQRRMDSMREKAADQQRTIQALTDRVRCLEELNQTNWQKHQAMVNLYQKKIQTQQELIEQQAQQLNASRRIHDN